ncbi:MAG: filamentous hemagglutinin N-terminal domain-containing protein [Cyanobacteria bacterium P01_G01_bin.19]
MLSANFSSYQFKISTLAVLGLGSVCTCSSVKAQIIDDRTTNTKIEIDQDVSHIMGGIETGNNLFHSFKQFSVAADKVANFDRSFHIENIFARVTGGSISQIDGLIQTQGNANLFLINPAGIIFGANAQLDIGGSFIASTAEQIDFADGTAFSAIAPELSQPILTISSPIGLQYGNSSGEIAVLANADRGVNSSGVGLSVYPGNTLGLLGGDITITRNSLNAIASNIEVGSVRSGTVGLQQNNGSWEFNYDSVSEYGSINLNNRALINSSGEVNIQGKTIEFSSGSGIRNFTNTGEIGGAVRLKASESVDFKNSFLFTQVGQISSDIEEAIAGSGGDIIIDAPKIFLRDGSIISAGTLSDGAGGNIMLKAAEKIELSGAMDYNPSIVSTSSIGMGDGGNIDVETGQLSIYDGSQIQALAGDGNGGKITANVAESINISGSGIVRSQDNLGNITETVLASGFNASSGFEGLPLELQPQGASGNIIITVPELTVTDMGRISVSNYGLTDQGAGNIEIKTNNLNLDTTGEIAANTLGKGGSIRIAAESTIRLDNQSKISTTAQQDGNGGNIFLQADNLLLLESNRVSADAQQGSGGNISIETQGLFSDARSQITASSQIDTKEGKIKTVTLDLNSRLHIGQREYFPLVAEDYIYTGCGAGEDFAKNRFQNIGRGGVPHNPTQEIANSNLLGDLGQGDRFIESKRKSYKAKEYESITDNNRSISEASNWKINAQGKVELIASKNPTGLMHSSACDLGR